MRNTTGEHRSYSLRIAVQSAFALASVFLAWRFASFVHSARAGIEPLPARPPGVEGYLPITGLMGLVDWIHSGTLNRVHPAATVLIIAFIAMSLLLRRSFCAWTCPVGMLSESLARLGRRVFGRNFRLPRVPDIALRALRYVLLGFFLWAILSMSATELRAFIDSPYNRVADIKMYLYFERMGSLPLAVIGALAASSVFVNGPWCRYLCPYGALAGIAGLLSPVAVARDEDICIDCKLCDEVCMARLAVSRGARINSVECTGCMDCLASCPSPGSLSIEAASRPMGVAAFASAVILIFVISYSAARLTGNWTNDIGDREYIERVSKIDSPAYTHPGAPGRGLAVR